MIITNETRLIDLTVGQLMELIQQPKEEPHRYVHGISGIASLFGCSIATANRIKKSGRIDDAIHQIGRTIIIDADLAIKLYKSKNI